MAIHCARSNLLGHEPPLHISTCGPKFCVYRPPDSLSFASSWSSSSSVSFSPPSLNLRNCTHPAGHRVPGHQHPPVCGGRIRQVCPPLSVKPARLALQRARQLPQRPQELGNPLVARYALPIILWGSSYVLKKKGRRNYVHFFIYLLVAFFVACFLQLYGSFFSHQFSHPTLLWAL